jgi:hypothetical protein
MNSRSAAQAERVNDFATPCFINLLRKFVFVEVFDSPLMVGDPCCGWHGFEAWAQATNR